MKTYTTQKKTRPKGRFRRRLGTSKPRKPFPREAVPNFFTLMNLFSGFLSIIHVLEGELEIAAWLIVIAGAFDALDGFMARITNSSTEFGIELDSLCDLVSFGVAPAILMYSYILHEFNTLGMLLVAIPVLCGAVRLSRFNVETKEEESPYFKGLPIPAQAIMMAAFFLTFHESPDLFDVFEYGVISVVVPAMLLFSVLMISTVPFDKVPRFSRSYIRKHRATVLLFLLYFALIILMQEYGLMFAFSIFILKGLTTSAIRFYQAMFDDEEPDDDDRVVTLDDFSSR